VPWHGKTGKWEQPIHYREKPKLEPEALQKELFVLETASGYLTRKPTRADVKSSLCRFKTFGQTKEEAQDQGKSQSSHKINSFSKKLAW